MAVLEKMKICGLRSFGPEEEDVQSIKFSSPLTLILGENGCGKTTIIESLNFVCASELPGGSRSGHGFVHDPKLNSTASTKGQVRLSLLDPKGNRYVIIKSVQLLNKGSTLQFKRLDSTLKHIKPDGRSEDLSSRCSDIDAVISDILGVPKAILNNVVFCHQENTAWPLDEAKKLKEKFDEIFGATKYNKCAETIMKMIKSRKENNKVLAVKVSQAGVIKKHVDKKRAELEEKKENMSKFEETVQEKENNLLPIHRRLQEICDLKINLSKLQENYTKKETTKKSIMEQRKELLKIISEEFQGSDEELQHEIVSFEANRKKIKDTIANLEKQLQNLDTEQKQLSREINKIQVKLGKLHGEKKQFEDTIGERNGLIKKTADGLRVDISNDLNSEEGVSSSLKTFSRSLEDARKSFETKSRECDKEEQRIQETIDQNRDRLSKVNHSIESKQQEIQRNKIKEREIDSQLSELDYSDEQLKTLQTKIARIDTDLKKWKESFDVDAVTKGIDDNKQKMRNDEEKLEELEREYKILRQNYITETEIDTQKADLVKRESEIRKLKNKHFDDFHKIFGDDVPKPELYKQTIETQKKINTNKANELNKKISSKQKEVTTLEMDCKYQKDKVNSLQKELQTNEEQIFGVCKGKAFDKMSGELHQAIEKLQKDKGQYSSAKTMYEKFVQEFQTPKPCCPVCQTGFDNKQAAVQEIVANIKRKIQGIPQKLKEVEEELKLKQEQYNNLLQLKPASERIEELNSSLIPEAQSELIMTSAVCEEAKKELDEFKKELISPQGVVDICIAVTGDATLIDQYQREINGAQKRIATLESQLVQVPSNRSRQQTEADIEDLKVDLNNARRNCEASQKKLQQHNDRCQELREDRSKHMEKQLQLQKAMQGKPQLEEQLAELKGKQEELIADIAELQVQLSPLKEELKQAEKNKETVRNDNKKKLNQVRDEVHKIQKILDDINKLQKKVDFYVQQNISGKLEDALNEHTQLKQKEEALEHDKNKIHKNITDVNKQLATQDGGFRNLMDNKTLRDKGKEEEILTKEIAVIKQQIGDHNFRTVLEEEQRLEKEKDGIKREISLCQGRNDQLKLEIKKVNAELNTPENKQAHTNYKKLMLEYSVSQNVIGDLEAYLKGLDFAILKFHQERMEQINKIIRQLWRSIYRGNDIDYIEIKTDKVETSGSRRAYNYKVVQMKTDVEIDMRGRCSAGQKVLACLIIRMALAETFSQNCGILALDEPTTNLDRANINSLCGALARIVNSRQAEKNFQLIIITHDEEFLNALNHSIDKVSYIWRVTRNEKGNSVITQEMLT